jgi:uncharacterized protein (TIGR00251 family)
VIEETPDGVLLDIKVIPRAGKSTIAGVRDGALLVRVAAAPVEGEANSELIDLLSRTFDLPKRNVVLVSGSKSRTKRVKVKGLSVAMLKQRLGSILE